MTSEKWTVQRASSAYVSPSDRTQLNVMVAIEFKDAINELAKRLGCFQQRVVVEAIVEYLNRHNEQDNP